MSQNLAGLTFLAFGTGAPDVISAIVASGDKDDGIEFSLGMLLGASVLVTTIGVSSVVFFANSVTVVRSKFIRDIIVYLFMLALVTYFSYDHKIVLWESICFFLIYLVYVLIAIVQDKCMKPPKKRPSEIDKKNNEEMAEKIAHKLHLEVEVVHHYLKDSSDIEYEKTDDPESNFQRDDNTSKKGAISDLISHDHFYEKNPSDNIGNLNYFDDDDKISYLTSYSIQKKNYFLNFLSNHYESLKYWVKRNYFGHKETYCFLINI
jgi:Ca2+/Na+ antiporter